MASPSRTTRATTLLALLALAMPGAALGPFDVLAWRDGVTTSRSGYAVWVGIASTEHQAKIPPHPDNTGSNVGHRAALALRCRTAGGPLPSSFPATATTAEIFLQNHPDHPGTYTVAHPMHWFLELTGQTTETFPVTVELADHPPLDTALVRPLVNYSAPHPGITIALVPNELLETIAQGHPINVVATGPDFHLDGRFVPSTEAIRAVGLMQRHCPVPSRTATNRP